MQEQQEQPQLSLFGGAITCSVPLLSDLLDTSTIRQVPDTQEVFLSKSIPNLSLIIEICESVPPPDPVDALSFHHSSLALDNASFATHILSLPAIVTAPSSSSDPLQTPAIALTSISKISKFNKSDSLADDVLIFMGLVRIESKRVDLVICVNYPLGLRKVDWLELGQRGEGRGEGEAGERQREQGEIEAKAVFDSVVGSLRVCDYALFV